MKKAVLLWVALLICGATYWYGYVNGMQSVEAAAVKADNDRLAAAFEQGQALGTVRDRVVTQYVDRVEYIEKRGATLIKEVPVYVSAKSDAACVVPSGFVRLHDAAASGADLPASGSAGTAFEGPSGVALSTVAATTASNYTACHANAEQLRQLQDLLGKYKALMGKQAPH
ncbi:hypothetical protein [Pseudomonas viridiflava]|uniref:hypothetical protein n=1 Tax=Pseudomonas viridiflava TaxID=33069 RepID=UPI000F043A7C|nr:hypothetical protein [Pseudomonas viridiflava]